jgi:hypothetical protein
MGLSWSAPAPLIVSNARAAPKSAGLYRISENGSPRLLYIGQSLSLSSRLISHTRNATGAPNFSCVPVHDATATYQLCELENDLIGGYFERFRTAPLWQFGRRNPPPAVRPD